MGGFVYSELAARMAEQAALAGGGGVTHHTDGLLAQNAGVAVGAAGAYTDLTWLAVLPDADGNITYAAPDFTVVNSGLYTVSLYGNWTVDNSIETDERLIKFAVVNVQSPAAQGVYAWAQGRVLQAIVPPATVNLTNGLEFGTSFTTMFEAGDQFKVQYRNTDAAQATEIEIVTLSVVKLA